MEEELLWVSVMVFDSKRSAPAKLDVRVVDESNRKPYAMPVPVCVAVMTLLPYVILLLRSLEDMEALLRYTM